MRIPASPIMCDDPFSFSEGSPALGRPGTTRIDSFGRLIDCVAMLLATGVWASGATMSGDGSVGGMGSTMDGAGAVGAIGANIAYEC